MQFGGLFVSVFIVCGYFGHCENDNCGWWDDGRRKRDASDRSSDGQDEVITLARENVGCVLGRNEVHTTASGFEPTMIVGIAVLFGTNSEHTATAMAIATCVERQTGRRALKTRPWKDRNEKMYNKHAMETISETHIE